ncbi:MFS transporter [Lactobacillus sp. ESL0791]|uniref:MFS transporter n=1 Tax=Lactobacillus sp. ESL0791 TaxID=2983234 RepID=UPI0023F7F2AD|nr:MFS transporter [Lactobacillus sp. ESL0791]MDF7638828.1 MFS transporter [Lactobacillus sp. ESL0791]
MKHKNIAKRIGLTFLLFTAVFTFFRSSMSGIFSLFYANNGIPDAQISSIKSFQSIGLLLRLLPAGYLADRVGRLKVLNFSALTMASSFLLLIFLKGFVFYAVAELIYDIGLALNSGTLLAYITDLQEKNKIVPSSKLMGMQVTVLNIATLLGGNIGTCLFSINMKAPIWFAMIGLILYPTFVIIFIKTMNFSDNRAQKKTDFEATSLFNLLTHFLKKKSFWILLLINIGYNCGTIFVLYYWSIIYVKNLHFNLSLVYTLFMCAINH